MPNPNAASSSFHVPPKPIGSDATVTIAAIATPPGRGAVAIVRVSGPAVPTIARAVFRAARATPGVRDASREPALPARVATYGRIVEADGTTIDRGLALVFPGPASYTGEDVLELHVHGSPAVARDTLLAVLAAGARLAEPGEFTRRAFEAGKLDLTAAEAVADLIAAEHRSVARAAAARLSGGLASVVDDAGAILDAIVEDLAAALDFPDEVPAPDAAALAARIGAIDAGLAALGATWEAGRLVREGLSIAIVGPPNAGKSSLLNALLGAQRALVSAVAGTTRDTIEEAVALGGGQSARLVDTAGLRATADTLEAAGIARARAALDEATLVLVVVDASRPLDDDARATLVATRARDRVVYFNKADLGRIGYDDRDAAEANALVGCVHEPRAVDAVRAALREAAGANRVDLARPHLGTVRQADAVLETRRALRRAIETLACGDPVDLAAGDLAAARASLRALTGRDASESLLDGIFARFCIGK
ncbi:MAG: tRNA uridine-5-carboxymethylaminomethyl(34) synthesis GTPase MnmE [Vulcanimicrobiaceae bacterium]